MADNTITGLLTRLSQSNDPLGNYARSVLTRDEFVMESNSADLAQEPEGSTDPFAFDPNVEALLASGIITDEEKEDPVALVAKLAGVLIGMRTAITAESNDSDPSHLNSAEVHAFDTYYREKLKGRAQLEIFYDDPMLFENLKCEEAAGLARALIAVTKCMRPLWVEISNTGRGK